MTVTLNYKSIGEGQPLLILHGLFGSLDNWQTMAKRLAEKGFEVFTIDLRNHGKSPHAPEMNYDIMAQDVAAFIEEKALKNVIVVGHSMGGKTAMRLALTRPELVEKLVVVDIAPKTYSAHHNTYFDAMMNLDVKALTSRGEAQEQLSKKVRNQGVLQFLLKNLTRNPAGGFRWKFNLPVLNKAYPKILEGETTLATFNQPTLFIDGQLSDYISNADHTKVQEYFPMANVATIVGAGHWVHAEKPNEFFNALIEFLG